MSRNQSTLILLLAVALIAPACGGGSSGGGSRKKKHKAGFHVVEESPRHGELAVARDTDVRIRFSHTVFRDSLTSSSFVVSQRAGGDVVPGAITLDAAQQVVVFEPAELLLRKTSYRVRVTTTVRSSSGLHLDQDFESIFTTALSEDPPPPPPPPPANGEIVQIEDLNLGRSSHTSTLLVNGKVLLTGGFYDSSNLTNSAEIYDPDEGKFAWTNGSMASNRGYHAAVRLGDGTVLVTGGVSGTSATETDTAELYVPASGQFSSTASKMAVKRAFHTATLLDDGRVLIAGGTVPTTSGTFSSRKAEIYDPAQGTFTALPDMNAYRAGHTATLLDDGTVLLAGGNSTDVTLELFDPQTDSFTKLDATLFFPRRGHTATKLQDGSVLLAGGSGSERTAALWVSSGKYIRKTPGYLLVERKDHTATLLPDGRVLLTGGSMVQGTTTIFHQSTELFDPNSGAFLGSSPFIAVPTTRHRATLLADGRILITGGAALSYTLPALSVAQIYRVVSSE